MLASNTSSWFTHGLRGFLQHEWTQHPAQQTSPLHAQRCARDLQPGKAAQAQKNTVSCHGEGVSADLTLSKLPGFVCLNSKFLLLWFPGADRLIAACAPEVTQHTEIKWPDRLCGGQASNAQNRSWEVVKPIHKETAEKAALVVKSPRGGF